MPTSSSGKLSIDTVAKPTHIMEKRLKRKRCIQCNFLKIEQALLAKLAMYIHVKHLIDFFFSSSQYNPYIDVCAYYKWNCYNCIYVDRTFG